MDNLYQKWNLSFLYLARLSSLTGSQVLFFAIPLLIYKMSNSVFVSGLAFALEWCARIISFPLSGYFADKFGSKKIYIISDLIIAILCAFAIILLWKIPLMKIIILIILSVVSGFLAEQGYVSAESLAPKLVTIRHYTKTQSFLELIEQIALLFGPVIAGVFILFFELKNLILAAMLFFSFSAAFMMLIKTESYQLNAEHHFISQLSAGFHTIYKYPYLINMMMLSMIINLLFGLMTGAAPIMIVGVYQKPDHFYALLNLAAGVFGACTILFLNYLLKKFSIVQIGMFAFITACFACMLLGIASNYFIYLFVYAIFYGLNGLFSIFFRSERVRVIPQEMLGRTIGAIIFITFLFFPISGLMISLSSHLLGIQNLIMLFGCLCLMAGSPFIFKIKRIGVEK